MICIIIIVLFTFNLIFPLSLSIDIAEALLAQMAALLLTFCFGLEFWQMEVRVGFHRIVLSFRLFLFVLFVRSVLFCLFLFYFCTLNIMYESICVYNIMIIHCVFVSEYC